MTVQELHRPRPLGLLKMVQNRQWASLALALENGAPAHVVVGHGRGAGKARIHMYKGCAAFFCLHNPLETNRMGFRHIGTHNKDAVAVAHVARKVGASAETE